MPVWLGRIVTLPSSGRAEAQLSPDCPPLATQLAAFREDQLSVTGLLTSTLAGVADSVTVGTVTATVTVALALTPRAVQLSPN